VALERKQNSGNCLDKDERSGSVGVGMRDQIPQENTSEKRTHEIKRK